MSRDFLRLTRSIPLNGLRQGGTLSIQSTFSNTNLRVTPAWRDDGNITLIEEHIEFEEEDYQTEVEVHQGEDRMTALGRKESFVSVNILNNNRYRQYEGSVVKLYAEVPEKLNLLCSLSTGGSIRIDKKIEGDVSLATTSGNITLSKLRGHKIQIISDDPQSTICAKDLLEAQQLTIMTPGRVRAKQIHGNNIDIQVVRPQQQQHEQRASFNNQTKVDDDDDYDDIDVDDDGSSIDISSLYVSGSEGYANLFLSSPTAPTNKSIRVKSNHGHVVAEAHLPLSSSNNSDDNNSERPLVVELGGVNGSCDVAIINTCDNDDNNNNNDDQSVSHDGDEICTSTSSQLHFDSLAPDTVSVVTCEEGDISLTLDRKLEADVRLVSGSNMVNGARQILVEDLDQVDDDESDSNDDRIWERLEEMSVAGGNGAPAPSPQDSRISIETNAFTVDTQRVSDGKSVEFVTGFVDNKSMEPDSRFDVETKRGKISLGGAASQALKSFSGGGGGDGNEEALPLLVAGTNRGKILVESLSWLGAIARRYGMNEEDSKENLGRTATRRGRALKTPTTTDDG